MTDKQKATYFRMQKAGFSISRREGTNIILSKQGTEIARIELNGHIYHLNNKDDVPQ
jgi:hypothetical protein